MVSIFDGLFLRVRSCRLCYRLTLFTRILLAAGFIPTGMVKLLGQRFTNMGVETPVGFFFEALYQSGGYWRFLGASQVLAGVLLLLPRTAHAGALLFVPILVNIFVITASMEFAGTPYVTGAMLLAVLYLCVWDFHRFRSLVAEGEFAPALPVQRLDAWERAGFWVFGISILGFFGVTRGFVEREFAAALVVAGLTAGVFTALRFLWASVRMWRVQALK